MCLAKWNWAGEPPWLDLLSDTTGLRQDSLADLSRYENDTDTAENNATVAAATTALEAVATVVTWDMVREATAWDKTFLNLIHYLEVGFPADCRQLPAWCRGWCGPYGPKDCYPTGKYILNALHAAYQGLLARHHSWYCLS